MYGAGATLLRNLPEASEFVQDPKEFFRLTRRHIRQVESFSDPGESGTHRFSLPRAGIVTKVWINFTGTFTVATADVTMREEAPYSLIEQFKLIANGSEVYSCSGADLKVLDHVRYPAAEDETDQLPGSTTLDGGDTLAVGAHDVDLSWLVPVAVDDTTCTAALYAQSAAVNLECHVTRAADSLLVNTAANLTVTGTFTVTTEVMDVVMNDGKIVIPDLSVMHRFLANSKSFTSAEERLDLIRSPGNLLRLFISGVSDDNTPLSAQPGTADANKIDRLQLEYGVSERPLDFNPASRLCAINNRWYGQKVPFDRLVWDSIKENPSRDAIVMQALSELALVVSVNSSVAVNAGKYRVVQETLS